MNSHDVERAYVAARLDNADAQFTEAITAMRAELDHLRESWSSGYAQQLAAHETRLTEIRGETQRYIASLYGDDDEGPHTDVAAQGDRGASLSSSGSSDGHSLGQQPHPREAELAAAQQIKDMDVATYARRRAELGVRSATDMSHLFGETR
jgi:hypothetical protein